MLMPILAAIAGYCVANVIAIFLDRLYTGAPWSGPALPCTGCARPLPRVAWLGTPSWLMLRGKCPACAAPLPGRLLALPLLGAAAFAIAAATVEGRTLLLALLFTVPLLALVATDFERKLLPNRIMYPTLIVALALAWAWPERSLSTVLLGGLAGGAIMFLLFVVLPGFGFGDVKLAALLGLLAGLDNVFAALAIAAIAGGIGGVILMLVRRATLRGTIAYGPYLALGAYWAMLAG